MIKSTCMKHGRSITFHASKRSMSTTRIGMDKKPLSLNVIDTATDYFASLRRRAAETLTSLLTDEERKELLKRLGGTMDESYNKEEIQEETAKSIGEAVIAARADEAKRQGDKWEREKDQLMKEAETAARNRVENDLLIQRRRLAMERWREDVEREKREESLEHESSTVASMEHPVLGPVLLDLGYKRVHIVSAETLQSIAVWKKQRIYRHDRAKAMASDKSKTTHIGIPGIIALHEDSDGNLSILDGQHRVGMMSIMLDNANNSSALNLDRILVEVFPEPENLYENFAQDVFTEINKAEPVKLVDMPGVASRVDRNVITEGAAILKERFPAMFRSSQRCRAPHLNVDNLRDALFAAEVLKKQAIKTPKALVEWMLAQNELLAVKFQQEDEAAAKVNKTALEKAIQYNFYLGLDSSWLYN